MKKIYFFLTFLLVVGYQLASSKVLNLSTNLTEATRVGYFSGFQDFWLTWDEDGNASCNLPNDSRGLTITVSSGYMVNEITVNDEVVSGMTSGSVFLESSNLPEGAAIYIKAQKQEVKSVLIKANPNQVSVTYQYRTYPDSEWANNQLKINLADQTSQINIAAKSGYSINSVKSNGDEVIEGIVSSYSINPLVIGSGENVFEIGSLNLEEARTSEFTLEIVGAADAVEYSLGATANTFVSVKASNATIKFNPDFDLPITIKSPVYRHIFYKVTADGTEITPSSDFSYSIRNLADGGKVTVDVDFPDVQIPVSFHFTNPDTEGALSSISGLSGGFIPEEEWRGENWTVAMGTYLDLKFDTSNYVIQASCNGESLDIDSGHDYYQLTAINPEGYDFEITATPLNPYEVTFWYEFQPSHFKVQVGSNSENLVELPADDDHGVIEVPRNKNLIKIVPDEGWVINTLYVNNAEHKSADILIEGTSTIDVFVEAFERNLEAVVYVDPEAEWNYKTITLSPNNNFRQNPVALDYGYNILRYNEQDLPLAIEVTLNGSHDYPAYLNGEQLPTPIVGLDELVPGSVLRLYGEMPEIYTVTFDIDSDAGFTLYRDILDELTNPETQQVLAGTQFEIVPDHVSQVIVEVNGVEQTIEDGKYIVNVNADTDLVIKKGTPTGTSTIGEATALKDVYSLQGIRVLEKASTNQINALPAGIYIVGGKKVVVK